MFPPETTQTTLPVPAAPLRASATGVAPAPSATTRARSARSRTASADLVQARDEGTVQELSRQREHLREHLRPADAVDEARRVLDLHRCPASSEAASGAAVATSAANTLQDGATARRAEAIPHESPPPP